MAKKHLGQNFLKSKKAIDTMASFAEGVVVEIGPGKGAITKVLLEKAQHVVAIEKDDDLLPFLQDKFGSNEKFHLVHDDVLEFDALELKKYAKEYRVIANIPYYITGAIIRYFLESNFQPKTMTLLVQKEVAERIVSRDGKGSILALSVQAYGEPKYIVKVGREYFSPKPDIDSAIIHIANISKDFFDGFSEEDFFTVVKTAFQFKRKTIHNNLKELFPNIDEVLVRCSIQTSSRAEDLDLHTFAKLARELSV